MNLSVFFRNFHPRLKNIFPPCPFLSSGPPTAIIYTSYQNLCLTFISLVFLNPRRISNHRHCLYCPGISASHRPHHPVILYAIARVYIHQAVMLAHAVVRLRKPLYPQSRVSAVIAPSVPCLHHHRLSLPISLFTSSLFYHISYGACVHHHFCCFHFRLSSLSRISAVAVVILVVFYWSHHHIVIHSPMSFTSIVLSKLWIWLIRYTPIWLFLSSWSTLLLLLLYDTINLLHSYC